MCFSIWVCLLLLFPFHPWISTTFRPITGSIQTFESFVINSTLRSAMWRSSTSSWRRFWSTFSGGWVHAMPVWWLLKRLVDHKQANNAKGMIGWVRLLSNDYLDSERGVLLRNLIILILQLFYMTYSIYIYRHCVYISSYNIPCKVHCFTRFFSLGWSANRKHQRTKDWRWASVSHGIHYQNIYTTWMFRREVCNHITVQQANVCIKFMPL